MPRFAAGNGRRAVLIRRLEALEGRREQQQPAPSRVFNVRLLTLDLLDKLVSVADWAEAHGIDSLQDEHHAIFNEAVEFYNSLEAQGVDIYDHSSKAAA